jgi:hypothetical protein
MSEKAEIDSEALKSEVEQIKDAMGLEKRYPSQFQLWLVFGLAVVLGSTGSQVIALREMSPFYHSIAWFIPMSTAGLYQGWKQRSSPSSVGSTETKPRLRVLYLSLLGLYLVFFVILEPATGGLASDTAEILLFSLIICFVGIGYIVAGEVLRAYYIRRRDRMAFYVGGAWMLVLAALMPNVAFLETWGYAVFGTAYGLHALGSYVALS